MFLFLSRAAPPPNEEEQMEDDAPPLPKRQPLSLEDMIAKKEAEAQAQAKVSACHDIYLACFCVVLISLDLKICYSLVVVELEPCTQVSLDS